MNVVSLTTQWHEQNYGGSQSALFRSTLLLLTLGRRLLAVGSIELDSDALICR